MSPDPAIEAAIARGQRKSAVVLADQARLASAMRGIFHEAGFSALVAAVTAELGRIAAEYGPDQTGGWVA